MIERALKTDGFVLLFQPIVALGQTAGLHYEAQLRLRAPDGELLPPREFFPVAERCGLMTAIDRWVMEYALDTLHDQRIRHPDLRLLVHQTMATVSQSDWLAWFREQLIRRDLTGIRPLLQFQMRDVRAAIELARVLFGVLQRAGVHICLGNITNSPSEIELVGRLGVPLAKLSIHTLTHTGSRTSPNWCTTSMTRMPWWWRPGSRTRPPSPASGAAVPTSSRATTSRWRATTSALISPSQPGED